MTKLVSTFLDQAYAAGDVRPTQLVMIMTQTLYKEIPKERKEPLSTPASTLTSTSSSSSSSSTTESPIARPPSAMSDTSSVTSVTSTTGTSNPLTKVSTTGSESGGRMRKVYLQAAVRDHQVWKDLRYWEEAFFDALTVALIRQGSVAQLTPSHGTDSFSSFTAHALAHALGVSSSSNDDDATTAEQEHVRREATFATLVCSLVFVLLSSTSPSTPFLFSETKPCLFHSLSAHLLHTLCVPSICNGASLLTVPILSFLSSL